MASGCNECGKSHSSYMYQPNYCSTSSKGCNCDTKDATCVTYSGAPLNCIGVGSNVNTEEIFLAIDSKLCQAVTGEDWTTFNYHCIDDSVVITNAREFVDEITDQFCQVKTSYNNFVTTTFPSSISNLQAQINAIFNPNLTLCPGSGITASDTYTSILAKLATGVCNLQASLDVSSANWGQCFTVTPTPVTVVEGFNTLIDQFCTYINTPVTVTLPTFNNVGTCLPGTLTASDSLVSTVEKIKTRLCQTGVFNIDDAPWDCLPNPNPGSGPNIQDAINTLVSGVNELTRQNPIFDSTQFIEFPDGCNGRMVSIDPDLLSGDRFVASDASDTTPGTLVDKLQAGTNITLDNLSTPGKITINSNVPAGLTFDPDLVDWNACNPCEAEIPVPTSIEEGFSNVLDKVCCLNDLITSDDSGIKVYYVDGNNPNAGDGSILNPFKTLDSAYAKMVGTGTPKAPQNTGVTIKVAAFNYSTALNLFAATLTWEFSSGTTVTYTGSDYLFNTLDSAEYTSFNVSGKWNFISANGALLRQMSPTLQSRINIEINDAEQTLDTEDPMTKPLIRVESNYGLAAWTRSRLDLAVHGRVRSTDNHVLFVDGYTEVYVKGLTAFAELAAGDGTPYSIVADQRVLYYNNQDPTTTNHMYSQEIRFDSIKVGSDGTSAIFFQGLYGSADFYNVNFDSLQAVENFQSSSIEIGNLTRAGYSIGGGLTKTRGFTIRNCKFADNIYAEPAPGFPTNAIVSVGTPGVNGISIINSLIPEPYLVDSNLVINDDLGVMANTITNFNIRNVPAFEDSTAAQTAGLVEGDVFRTEVSVPDTATPASGDGPTKVEFDALLAELRALKELINSANVLKIV